MKEFDKLMEAIEKRDIPAKFKFVAKVAGYSEDAENDEQAQKILDKCIFLALGEEIKEDRELEDLFVDFAFTAALNTVVAKLAIKVPEKGQGNKSRGIS